jgi:glyoxylase-like metal-dependent hydrolase (beta-lactamase superfamily II)/rhodanese-related sulfurtransferase
MDKVEICPVRKYMDSPKEYYIEQIQTGCLSQFAYFIESKGEAIVIDPMLDTENILCLLKTRNAKLKYIFETHFHADFVSGHINIAKKTGAEIVFGPSAIAGYKIIVAEDNQEFKIGEITIKVIHTPGHTIESSCLLLLDKNGTEKAIFTGDTVFLGDVGRPDLAVTGNIDLKTLAGYLFESIQKIKKLSDEVIVFPGHGAGSACGKSIQIGNGDSLKNQRERNFALNDKLSKEDFVALASSNLSTPPKYFFFDAQMNKEGYEDIDKMLNKTLTPLKFEEFQRLEKEKDVVVIDTRDANDSTKEFLRGTFLIPLNITYAIWCATLFKPENRIIIISSPGTEKESIVRLFRVGYYNILGYLDGGIEAIKKNEPSRLTSIEKIDYAKAKNLIDENKIVLVDVREIGEFENTGVIENSHLCPLSDFDAKINEIKNSQKSLGIYCRSGARATIASSILKRYNINNFKWMGNFTGLVAQGAKVVKYLK